MKVGDRVKVITGTERGMAGTIYTINKLPSNFPIGVVLDETYKGKTNEDWVPKGKEEYAQIFEEKELKLIKEAPMNLRERIEALTGWDKEADDIIVETGLHHRIVFSQDVPNNKDGTCGHGDLTIYPERGNNGKTFHYSSQCSKLQAFKSALLWLAEKAGKLEDKSKIKEEIAELREKLERLEKAVIK